MKILLFLLVSYRDSIREKKGNGNVSSEYFQKLLTKGENIAKIFAHRSVAKTLAGCFPIRESKE